MKTNLPCKNPTLRYTRMNTDHLSYCTTKDEALEVDTIVYNTAIKNLDNKVCEEMCSLTKYTNKINEVAKNALIRDYKQYIDGDYAMIWMFYSSLEVPEKVEHYTYDLTKTVAAIEGTISMFLGWSIKSLLMSGFEFINDKMVKGPNIKETHKTYSHKLTQTYPQNQITKHTLSAILDEILTGN